MAENSLKKAQEARRAFLQMAPVTEKMRNEALLKMAKLLEEKKGRILVSNKKDVLRARRQGVSPAMLKRLELSEHKFGEIVHGVESVAAQVGQAGKVLSSIMLDEGLVLEQVSVPIGVVCAIFEARPDALCQISALAIKTGNCVILKGGSEARETNRAIFLAVRGALKVSGLPPGSVQLAESREAVNELLGMDSLIDLIIPRGGSAFVKYIMDNSKIPVLGHSEGVCHEYVDESADVEKAVKICVDAKTNYPAACNAMETLLVHEKIAEKFLPAFAKALGGKAELRADPQSLAILAKNNFRAKKAIAGDFGREFSDLVLSVKIVKSCDEAISHINRFGSKHTDGIITQSAQDAEKFLAGVDSAGVYWNASTRFADGYRYGKGAEVGISTGKLHCRGPGGAEALLTYKYILRGDGHVVSDYTGDGAKKFLHRKLLPKTYGSPTQ
ncbi:MAG TPA: glutamate-5-semialdehyde dehydrogenase [Candidatus Diapherotrites archaeon]|uniref:Gamma-glutamyl phosphate reductase n=1 Tax=Candidatus Iainarchaeum sp. TaxID=3101447 RepID=A0A7J4IWU6_9ARCH|nr:glutamate-5-semialdehyde dehydrogenase [Candidatus Diapherotrites archaeon]